MPYLEILAPAASPETRQAITEGVTAGICEAFSVGPQTVTLYFLDVGPGHYAHAGQAGAPEEAQRVFVKVHAYRRGVAERRAAAAALTPVLARHYGVPAKTLAIYFLDRAKDEVAHGGRLSSDAEPD